MSTGTIKTAMRSTQLSASKKARNHQATQTTAAIFTKLATMSRSAHSRTTLTATSAIAAQPSLTIVVRRSGSAIRTSTNVSGIRPKERKTTSAQSPSVGRSSETP